MEEAARLDRTRHFDRSLTNAMMTMDTLIHAFHSSLETARELQNAMRMEMWREADRRRRERRGHDEGRDDDSDGGDSNDSGRPITLPAGGNDRRPPPPPGPPAKKSRTEDK